jgi:hypothetical protein
MTVMRANPTPVGHQPFYYYHYFTCTENCGIPCVKCEACGYPRPHPPPYGTGPIQQAPTAPRSSISSAQASQMPPQMPSQMAMHNMPGLMPQVAPGIHPGIHPVLPKAKWNCAQCNNFLVEVLHIIFVL